MDNGGTICDRNFGSLRFISRPDPETTAAELCPSPPKLQLACFAKPPRIAFDDVEIDRTSVKNLTISNPNDYPVRVIVTEIAEEKGLGVFLSNSLGKDSEVQVAVFEPFEDKTFVIAWTPKSYGKMRANICFKWDGGPRLTCIVFGNCPEKRNAPGRKRSGKSLVQKSKPLKTGKENVVSKCTNTSKLDKVSKMLDNRTPVKKKDAANAMEKSFGTETLVNISTPRRTTFAIKKEEDKDTGSKTEGWRRNFEQVLNHEVEQDLFGNVALQPRHSSPENESMRTFLQNMEDMSALKTEQDLISFDATVLALHRSDYQLQIDSIHHNKLTAKGNGLTYVKQSGTFTPIERPPNKTYELCKDNLEEKHVSELTIGTPPEVTKICLVTSQPNVLGGGKVNSGNVACEILTEHSPLSQVSPEVQQECTNVLNTSFEFFENTRNKTQELACSMEKKGLKKNTPDLQPIKKKNTRRQSVRDNVMKTLDHSSSNGINVKRSPKTPSFGNQTMASSGRQLSVSKKVKNNKMDRKSIGRQDNTSLACCIDTPNSGSITKVLSARSGKKSSCEPAQTVPRKTFIKATLPVKRLKLLKPPKSTMARHPLPYATKNTFYDEKWMQKQEKAFTSWLNFVLTPSEDLTDSPEQISVVDTNKNQPIAPSREDLSYRAYSAKRKMARLRYSACTLYQSDLLSVVICKVESEVERGRIAIREDRRLEADIGIKKKILDMLMMFNMLWLRIGLEVVYGEIIPMQSNADITMLTRFIMQRLLSNPDISRQYAHHTVPGLHKKGYEVAMHKFILKKLLLLILFLDHAKRKRLIDHDPCLFKRDAEFKCCKDMLLAFSREYLKGEGDISRHLFFLGYNVLHNQSALDEFDFGVENIAVDLRSGVRLVRVIELITQDWNLTKKVRVPAVSRLQKIHNVEVAFERLKALGLKLMYKTNHKLDPRQIVDGHREKTLALLWEIILHFKIRPFLDPEKLRKEISFVYKMRGLKEQDSCNEDFKADWSFTESMDSKLPEGVVLLLTWCRVVCALYDTKVENLSSSFSDGRAFCYLVHHYHPDILPKSKIVDETSLTCCLSEDKEHVDDELIYENWSECCSPNSGKNRKLEELFTNERRNFDTLNDAVRELGGIPSLVCAAHMSNTIPDEKVIIMYLSYLSLRVVDIQQETKAARTIQLCWRYYCKRKRSREEQVRHKAATTIQKFVRKHLDKKKTLDAKQHQSAVIIQSLWRRYSLRKVLRRRRQAAVVIQRCYRSWVQMQEERKSFLCLRSLTLRKQEACHLNLVHDIQMQSYAAIQIQRAWRLRQEKGKDAKRDAAVVMLQKHFRGMLVRSRYTKLRAASIDIQRRVRAYNQGRESRINFLRKRNAAVLIQRTYRDYMLRRSEYCVKVQACVRMWLMRRKYLSIQSAAVMCQSHYRMKKAYNEAQNRREAVIKIQRWYRSVQQMNNARKATVSIQAYVRGFLARKHFEQLKAAHALAIGKKIAAAIVLQRYVRGWLGCRKYQKLRHGIVCLQALIRGRRERKYFQNLHSSATVIQCFYRQHLTDKKIAYLRDSLLHAYRRHVAAQRIQSVFQRYKKRQKTREHMAVKIQTMFRSYRDRKCFNELRLRVVQMQLIYRGNQVMKRERETFLRLKKSCLVVQSIFRMQRCRRSYWHKKRACLIIQKHVRGYLVRRKFQRQRLSVVRMQAIFRGFRQRQILLHQHNAASTIQSVYRGHLARSASRRRRDTVLYLLQIYRSSRVAALQRRYFLRQRNAAITVQAFVKMVQQRKRFNCTRKSAVAIQSFVRMKIARRRYLTMAKSTRLIQTWLKSMWLGRQVRAQLIAKHEACVVIQRNFRRYRNVKDDKRRITAAVVIQTAIRRYLAVKSFQRKRDASVILQRHYRAYRRGRLRYIWYNIVRGAAITIQVNFRGYLVRRNMYRRAAAAVCIQKNYRRYKSREKFLKQRNAVVSIQRFYQGYRNMRKCQLEFSQVRYCVVRLQAHVRSFLAKTRYNALRTAVVKIQRAYRVRLENQHQKRQQEELIFKCVVLQAAARGYIQRKQYLALKSAAEAMQRRYRAKQQARLEREQYLHLVSSVKKIQALTRGWVVRRQYRRLKAAALCIQWNWRAVLKGRKCRADFLLMKDIVITLQSLTRMIIARKRYLQQKNAVEVIANAYKTHCFQKRKNASAIVIQSVFREHLARCQYRKRIKAAQRIGIFCYAWIVRNQYRKLKRATIGMQRVWRANKLCYTKRQEFLSFKCSVVVLQSAVRMFIQRRTFLELKSATIVIQSLVRRNLCINSYQRKRNAAIVIQRHYRSYIEKKMQKKRERAVVLLQTLVRRRICMTAYRRQRQAVIRIQTFFRQWLQDRKRRKQELAVIKLQSAFRRYTCLTAYQSKLKAIRRIQHCFRKHLEVTRDRERKEAVIKLQSLVRRNICMKVYVRKRQAIIRIQTFIRQSQRDKRKRQKEAAVVLQNFFKMVTTRQRFLRFRRAVIRVQELYRLKLRVVEARRQRLRMKEAVISIQATFRMYIQRHKFIRTINRIILIQSHVRRFLAVSKFRRASKAATMIQAVFRGYLVRKSIMAKKWAALVIQAHFKGYKERHQYRNTLQHVVFIQRCYRNMLLGNKLRARYLRLRSVVIRLQRVWRRKFKERRRVEERAVVVIQSAVRMWIAKKVYLQLKLRTTAAIKIQAIYRGHVTRVQLQNHPFMIRKQAAVTIQSYWRGYLVRKNMNKRLSAIRRRIKEAGNCADDSMKLCNRTKSTLDYLLKCKKLSTVYDALTFLEFGSRISPKCCEQITRDGAVEVLYGIIRKCNRSLASIEIIQLTLKVLTNLAKCTTTYRFVYLGNDVGQLMLDLLTNFRDKNKGSIFQQTCFLLTILGYDVTIAKKIMEVPNFLTKLESLHKILARKHNMASARLHTKEKVFEQSLMRSRRIRHNHSDLWHKVHSRRSSERTPLLAITALHRCFESKTA